MFLKHVLAIFIISLMMNMSTANAKVRGSVTSDNLYSKILAEDRELIVHLPNNYRQNTKLNYPVLYLLDGQRNFSHAVGTLDLLNQSHMAQEMIIIAIKNTHRTRDFTPTYDESYNQWGVSGGADNFLDFLEQELIPHVNKRYRTSNFKTLSGHSLSGLLAVYALQSRPQLFQAHFAFSPSLWWHNEFIFKDAKKFLTTTTTTKLSNYLYINMGNEGGNMLSTYEKYTQLLKINTLEGFSFNADLVEMESHNTTALVGHNLAFRNLAAKFRCPEEVIAQGLPAIENFFKKLSEKYNDKIKPSYRAINSAGYLALKENEPAKAIKIFRMNVKNFPYKADAYDSLADGLEANGQLREALKMMDIALNKSIQENVESNAYKTHRTNLTKLIKDKTHMNN